MFKKFVSLSAAIAILAGLCAVAYGARLLHLYKQYRLGEVVIETDLPGIAGYTLKPSYTSGDSIEVYVHSATDFVAELIRADGPSESTLYAVRNGAQLQSEAYSLKFGYDWQPTLRIPSAGLKSGLYLVKLSSVANPENVYNVPVLITSAVQQAIVVVSPTNTWQAYNHFGGISNYVDFVTPSDLYLGFEFLKQIDPGLIPNTHLPNQRPYSHPITRARRTDSLVHLNGKISADLHMLEYLERRDYPYSTISDLDFEKRRGLDSAKLIIFHNHSEYWSYEAMGILRNTLSEGVNVAFLSGNNIFRRVESEVGNTLVVKDQGIHRSTAEPIIGTHYSLSGYQEDHASFTVRRSDHWIYDGTGLKNGDSFGSDLISGIETDKLGPFSEGFELIAIGDSPNGPAHMVIKEHALGNFLFNSSSVSSVSALDLDDSWDRMVENLIDRALNGDSSPR